MEDEKFGIVKFFSGFNIFDGANLAKIFYIVLIVSACLGVFYKLFLQRTVGQITEQTQDVQFQGATISTVDLRQTVPQKEKNNSATVFGAIVGKDPMVGGAYSRRF